MIRRPTLALSLVAVLLLAACAPRTAPAPTAPPVTPEAPAATSPPSAAPTESPGVEATFTPAPTPSGPVTLTVWHGWPDQDLPALQETFDAYTRANPQVTIRLERVPDLPARVLAAVPEGEGPDIVALSNEWIGQFSDERVIIPLDGYMTRQTLKDTFLAPAAEGVVYRGQVWAFPTDVRTISLIYNKAQISAEEVPQDTDALLAQGRQWMQDHPEEYLFVYTAKRDAYFSSPWWHAAGAYFVDEEGAVGIDTPGGLLAARFIASLPGIMPPELDYGLADSLFREGKAAMTMNGPWYLDMLERTGLDYGLALIPTFSPTGEPGAPFVGVGTLMITAQCPYPAVAADVLKLVTSRGAQASVALANETVPANKAALEAPDVQALPIVQHFGLQAARGVPMPATPYMNALWDPMSKGLEALWTGSATPEEAVRQIQEQAEAAIREMKK